MLTFNELYNVFDSSELGTMHQTTVNVQPAALRTVHKLVGTPRIMIFALWNLHSSNLQASSAKDQPGLDGLSIKTHIFKRS